MAKVCLIVIDGWGILDKTKGNAIHNADTPVMDGFAKDQDKGKYLTLAAHGLSVGLPDGLMGNSEVGHLNIGAGRVVYQDIVRINLAMDTKAINQNENLVKAFERAKTGNGRLHFLGLVSDGGVHAHINHLFCLLEAAKEHKVPNTYVQFFGDGRDTSPTSGVGFVKQVLDKLEELQYGKLGTVVGRYYAMDRDKRWERIKLAHEGLVQGIGEKATKDTLLDVVKARYEAGETDEFLKPIILDDDARVQDGDTLVFIDFRADRMRQIAETFGIKPPFDVSVIPKDLGVFSLTQYKEEFPFPALFPPQKMDNVLAEWLAKKNVPQYHCAETEKYAHVTFFFNGGREVQFDKEERSLVPSPKVATYDLQPEMSCAGVADKMIETIEGGKYPFLMCNFAPPDMVGHTGKYEPAVIACAATDVAIGRINEACQKHGYVMLVTADHGNAEQMYDENGKPFTAHTCNRVPFVMSGGTAEFKKPEHNAAICDVAPTVLDLMGLDIPEEMTGQSLLKK
ncbi:2,3-bisphosphoglycerate-independent phosphoglycerate mutase-like [Branchiostoma floridae]|uniref:2,3-bisphosphoglycerate-independent phosphoglycerate mutase n=1 Tax=Branchiostoma floridae TaxID=7739 RepID=A0A9J7HVF2_BRAFL|nr:2,3-bisphosphoglycerate-independent phosphoglycerate mutase-like [Branchiostoma floridae]